MKKYVHLIINKRNMKTENDGFRMVDNSDFTMYIFGRVYDRNWRLVVDEEFLSALIRSWNNIYSFNGKWCGIIIEKAKKRITMFRDRTGLAHLFYYFGKRKIVFSDKMFEIANIEGVKLEEDLEVVGIRLLYGSFLGDRTQFKNIRIVPVGKVISLDLDGNVCESISDPVFRCGFVDERALEDIAQDTKEALERAVINIYNNANKEVVFTMTGGRDSRLLLGLANNNGLKGRAFCVDNDGGFDEIRIAEQLNEYLNMPARYYYNERDYYYKYMDECLIKSEFMTTSHVWFKPFEGIEELHKTLIVMGLRGGEILQINNGQIKTMDLLDLTSIQKRDGILNSILGIKQYLKDDFYYEISEKAMGYMSSLLNNYNFNKRGLTDYYLEGICYNNVEYILSMFPMMDGISPYTDTTFLDIAFKYPEKKEFIDGTFYKKLYDNVDNKLWNIDSTRSAFSKDKYFRERYADSKYVMQKIFDLFMADNTGIIDKNKTEKILNRRYAAEKYNLNKSERWLYAYLFMREYIKKFNRKNFIKYVWS